MTAPKRSLSAGFDFRRLGGGVNWGSNAFYRKVATQDARLAMADIIKKYSQFLDKLKAATPEIVHNALKPTFKRAQYYVPEKTGALWESGKLTYGVNDSGRAFASITFGNDEAWYAALVHEFVWQQHEAPTRSKYLQAAMEENIDGIMKSLQVDYTGLMK